MRGIIVAVQVGSMKIYAAKYKIKIRVKTEAADPTHETNSTKMWWPLDPGPDGWSGFKSVHG